MEVLSDYMDLPFVFFGHSMGALISYALCRELRRVRGLEPARLFVSGSRAPHLSARTLPIHRLPKDAFLAELRTRYDGIPLAVLQDREMMDLFLPVLRADLELVESAVYTPGEPLSCPISVFGGLEDRAVNREELEGWREQTSASFKLRMFPGDHFYLRESRAALLQAISEDLAGL